MSEAPLIHHELITPPGGARELPVVLSGSLGSNLSMWDPQVEPLLRAGYPVIRYDHRGHGRSRVTPGPYSLDLLAADVRELLHQLGRERVHFVGLSLGGMVGMWLASHLSERIERLVLMCTFPRHPEPDTYTQRAALVRAKGTPAVAEGAVTAWFTQAFAEDHPDRIQHFREMIEATPTEGYAGCCEAIAGMDLREDIEQITAPTLVIAGEQDQRAPVEDAETIVSSIPAARLSVVPQAAHLANAEQPEACNELILKHLAEG